MFQYAPRGLDEEIVPTEWVGGYSNASAVADATCSVFGEHVLHQAGPHPSIEWSFASTGGEREIWAQYAALTSRPVSLTINGTHATSSALWETTGGWREPEQTSCFQLTTTLLEGTNTLRIDGTRGLPHIRSISVCYPQGAKPDVELRLATAADLSRRNDAQLTGLRSGDFAQANGFIAALKRRGLTSNAMVDLFRSYLDAHERVQSDITLLGGFGGPFNGERLRMRIVNDVAQAVPFSAFIETGAFVGTTTEHFARSGIPVMSCEAMLDNFLVSALRLSRYENVALEMSDSRTFLRKVLGQPSDALRCPLFYLDAHWFDDLPLPEELNIIFASLPEYFVVVDDFEVPGSRYFYDRYENGNELTFKFVMPKLDLSTQPVFMVPANASTEETGPRKGTLFVAPRALYRARLRHVTRLKVIDVQPYL